MNELLCGPYRLALNRPLVMGIVNLTPDSFSGDGLADDTRRAIEHARCQLEAGADLLDLGAESSRPGAIPAGEAEELARLLPVIREVATWGVPVSVDTYKPAVMRAALEAGAAMINDIYALRMPGALEVVRDHDCGLCLMHMQGEPLTMQQAPDYGDVVSEVTAFLAARVAVCRQAGIADGRLVLDPGFGFGKRLAHNIALFRALTVEDRAALPWLVGVSRKSMLGEITGKPVGDRMVSSVAAAMLAAQRGAAILRVHDVSATCDALSVLRALV
jgi:dihydropteroate synthase